MASNQTGRWVQRAATTGGGRTYRGQAPLNWYASLVVICVLGLLLIGYSRYERTHPSSSSAGQPTTSTQWYAGLGIDLCGTMQPSLQASPASTKTGLTATGTGVISIAPKNSSETGQNATLGKFVSEYPGLSLSSSSLQVPGKAPLTNNELCPKGSPDAGKPGVVIVVSWPNPEAKGKGTETSGAPQDLRLANAQMITMAFVPVADTVPKPPAQTVTSLLQLVAQAAGNQNKQAAPTTTTLPVLSPTTTVPALSTTTTPSGSAK